MAVAVQKTLNARARSALGTQRETADVQLGNAPASPAPKRKRTASRARKLVATPVRAVKADHQRTIRVRILRGPIRSPRIPLGISKSAYAKVNAPITQPQWLGLIAISRCILGPATAMHRRSRYITNTKANRSPR